MINEDTREPQTSVLKHATNSQIKAKLLAKGFHLSIQAFN